MYNKMPTQVESSKASQELADRLNLPPNCHLVITAHDELSFDVVCRDTGKAFCTFVPLPWPKPEIDTLVINSESTWSLPNGREAIVAYGKMLFGGDEEIDFESLGFVESCPRFGECDDGEFRAEKGLAWLDDIRAIRGWCEIFQYVIALPSSSWRDKSEMDEIMDTLTKNTDDGVQPLSKPTDKTWSLPDLFIRQFLNNMVDGFGMSNVYEMFRYLLSKKNTLIKLGMISKEGYNNSGFPLWKDYNFKNFRNSKTEILDFIEQINQRNRALKQAMCESGGNDEVVKSTG